MEKSVKYYIVDAFASRQFRGNPAGVCVLEEAIEDKLMQSIAAENNLSETAFVLKQGDGYSLRWFTPKFEINLCGHATLGTAYVVSHYIDIGATNMKFETMSGTLQVTRKDDVYEMTFPRYPLKKIEVTQTMIDAIGTKPIEAYAERDLYLLLEHADQVKNIVPDYYKMLKLSDWMGVVVMARGDGETVDFVSRFFCPELNLEDPVTGSSHSSLIPYWSEKLGKNTMVSRQLSERGGTLYCEDMNHCVKISGQVALYLKGELNIEPETF